MLFNHAMLNGSLLPAEEAQISIFNQALFGSFGVYETVKIDQGRPFYLIEHLQRLYQSARMIELPLPIEVASMADWVRQFIDLEPQATWSLKILAIGPVESDGQPVIAMRPEPLVTYREHFYQQGASAITYEGQRTLPACKSLNTLVNFLARREAVRRQALEGLLHHQGQLMEGSRSNLFVVAQGRLLTPPESEVLSGITREIVLHTMQTTAHPVTETALSSDLARYDEIFITSTSMHVMPITRLDGRPVGTGQVGPVTKLAMARFAAHYQTFMTNFGR